MFGDLGKMMKAAANVKKRLPEVQAKLAASEFTGRAGDGAVSATVNGKLKLLDVTIGPEALSAAALAEDASALAEMIKAAVTDAQRQAAEAAVKAMQELTGGMSLPGLDGMV